MNNITKKLLSTIKVGKINCLAHFNFVRNFNSRQLVYDQFGEPKDVIRCEDVFMPSLKECEVLVKIIAAPINPADINTIQGKYPVRVTFPKVPGNEAVCEVVKVDCNVPNIKVGDRVIITTVGLGTWREHAVIHCKHLKVVPPNLGIAEAATLSVNPCTAYRMLTDFKPVRIEKSAVIQNGANSACGQMVTQLCRIWDIPNISIIRDRPDADKLKDYLRCLGATCVLTDKELQTTDIFKKRTMCRPALALNCVGGDNALNLLRQLDNNGVMVTYGGMSREPVKIPTASFIFKNLSFCGFWMTRWKETATQEQSDSMLDELINFMSNNMLRAPICESIKFEDYRDGITNALKPNGYKGSKSIFYFTL